MIYWVFMDKAVCDTNFRYWLKGLIAEDTFVRIFIVNLTRKHHPRLLQRIYLKLQQRLNLTTDVLDPRLSEDLAAFDGCHFLR